MAISKTIGVKEILKNLNKEISKLNYRLSSGLEVASKTVLDVAKEKTPFATGNLYHSGFVVWKTPRTVRSHTSGRFVNPPDKKTEMIAARMTVEREEEIAQAIMQVSAITDDLTSIVGFSAFYALEVHENPRSGQTGGVSPSGKWIYPEGTWADNGEWKFLENAVKETAPVVFDILKEAAKF